VWIGQDQALKDLYPHLYSFTKKKTKCSIQYFIEQDDSILFSLPLSQQAANQMEEIENYIQESNFDEYHTMIFGVTIGDLQSSVAAKHTISCKGTLKHHPSFHGFGPLATWENTNLKFSSGCFLGTG
jgi:hypothetical protein